jgi:hypothetical protein
MRSLPFTPMLRKYCGMPYSVVSREVGVVTFDVITQYISLPPLPKQPHTTASHSISLTFGVKGSLLVLRRPNRFVYSCYEDISSALFSVSTNFLLTLPDDNITFIFYINVYNNIHVIYLITVLENKFSILA